MDYNKFLQDYPELKKDENESLEEYCERLSINKFQYNLTWIDIKYIVQLQTGWYRSEDTYRKKYKQLCDSSISSNPTQLTENLSAILQEIKFEKAKLSEERVQNGAYIKTLAREQTLKEIALQVANKLNAVNPLTINHSVKEVSDKVATLLISDWHYGIEVNSIYNKYSPEIAIQRIQKLADETYSFCKANDISTVYVLNLGDLISGIIHLPLRLQSREDVISQTIHVSEILADFLYVLGQNFNVKYCSVTDNHSRIDPNKKTSLQVESFSRFTDWHLKYRLAGCKNIEILDNEVSDDIATLNILGHNIICVHGDKDKQKDMIPKLSTFTRKNYDMIFSAHLHHFSCEEENECMLISNGSLMGTDDYAFSKRLNSKPSQTIIAMSEESPYELIKKIDLQ